MPPNIHQHRAHHAIQHPMICCRNHHKAHDRRIQRRQIPQRRISAPHRNRSSDQQRSPEMQGRHSGKCELEAIVIPVITRSFVGMYHVDEVVFGRHEAGWGAAVQREDEKGEPVVDCNIPADSIILLTREIPVQGSSEHSVTCWKERKEDSRIPIPQKSNPNNDVRQIYFAQQRHNPRRTPRQEEILQRLLDRQPKFLFHIQYTHSIIRCHLRNLSFPCRVSADVQSCASTAQLVGPICQCPVPYLK